MEVHSPPELEAQTRDQGGSRLRSLQASREGPSWSLPAPGGWVALLAAPPPGLLPSHQPLLPLPTSSMEVASAPLCACRLLLLVDGGPTPGRGDLRPLPDLHVQGLCFPVGSVLCLGAAAAPYWDLGVLRALLSVSMSGAPCMPRDTLPLHWSLLSVAFFPPTHNHAPTPGPGWHLDRLWSLPRGCFSPTRWPDSSPQWPRPPPPVASRPQATRETRGQD